MVVSGTGGGRARGSFLGCGGALCPDRAVRHKHFQTYSPYNVRFLGHSYISREKKNPGFSDTVAGSSAGLHVHLLCSGGDTELQCRAPRGEPAALGERDWTVGHPECLSCLAVAQHGVLSGGLDFLLSLGDLTMARAGDSGSNIRPADGQQWRHARNSRPPLSWLGNI